jgi:hypothetical protein
MKYVPVLLKGDARLTSALPQLQGHSAEIRQWSVRRIEPKAVSIESTAPPKAEIETEIEELPELQFDFDSFEFSPSQDDGMELHRLIQVITETGVNEQRKEELMLEHLQDKKGKLPKLLRTLCPRLRKEEVRAEVALEIETPWETDVEVRSIAACLIRTLTGKVVGMMKWAVSAMRGLKDETTVETTERVTEEV